MELKLNEQQQEAVLHTQGPLLILAGAGSGKTRVLTHRIAHLINIGVDPWNILAITFTNKAAEEMRQRVDDTTDNRGCAVWVSTFHSMCVRILRRHIDLLGYDSGFSIYDTDDQKQVMRRIIKEQNLDPKMWREKMVLSHISHAKESMVDAVTFAKDHEGDYRKEIIAKLYLAYETELKKSNALDFDDLLVKTVELFRKNPEVLRSYQDRFKYIMVDEYQDTNTVQFMLVELLAQSHKNLCVVGDDDQSIYKFRGADIRNILNFEKYFPDAKVIKLEENYRSTTPILNAANAVIANNKGRKKKTLWTRRSSDELVTFKEYESGNAEAAGVANEICKLVGRGKASYNDFAILYRTNAQSRLFEEQFVRDNVPYKLVGGVNFYSRKEIKDILSYLKLVDNSSDDLSLRRIINVPKRGIGDTLVNRVAEYANENDISLWEGVLDIDSISSISRGRNNVKEFTDLMLGIKHFAQSQAPVADIIDKVIEESGYGPVLQSENTDESKARLENIYELKSKAADYDNKNENGSLSEFLEEVSLVADIDSLDESEDRVVLMTLHGSKGLEFPYVYLTGMEEGVFPSYMCLSSEDEGELEEERRLAYVGMTRAKDRLTLTCARSRIMHGATQFNQRSRFINEVPDDCLDVQSDRGGSGIFVNSGREYGSSGNYSGYGSSNGRDSYGSSNGYSLSQGRYGEHSGAVNNYTRSVKKKKEYEKYGSPYKFDFEKTVAKGSALTSSQEDGLEYGEGDRVIHIKFGEGTVKTIEEGARDFKVTVDFDNGETRTMFAAFAKLKKI